MKPHQIIAIIIAGGFITFSDTSRAQTVNIGGLTGCQKANNGRYYCYRSGTNNLKEVDYDFFNRYEIARTGSPAQPPISAPPSVIVAPVIVAPPAERTTIINQVNIVGLTAEASDIRSEILLLGKLVESQRELQKNSSDQADVGETIGILDTRLKMLKNNFKEKTIEISKLDASIKPDDAEMHITARKLSETFPRINYYIPGTTEKGLFWVEPVVSEQGNLFFRFQFVDERSKAENKIRTSIEMSTSDLDRTKLALIKAGRNSRIAHEKSVRRKIDLRIDCFPTSDCPPEGKKIENKSSTEIIFSVNEDASTGVRIQRNKGRFEEGYNISIPSARILQAYIHFVLVAGTTEHEIGSKSSEELKDLFK